MYLSPFSPESLSSLLVPHEVGRQVLSEHLLENSPLLLEKSSPIVAKISIHLGELASLSIAEK
jgi:hypothetical protein